MRLKQAQSWMYNKLQAPNTMLTTRLEGQRNAFIGLRIRVEKLTTDCWCKLYQIKSSLSSNNDSSFTNKGKIKAAFRNKYSHQKDAIGIPDVESITGTAPHVSMNVYLDSIGCVIVGNGMACIEVSKNKVGILACQSG
jgi:hypothetical protein